MENKNTLNLSLRLPGQILLLWFSAAAIMSGGWLVAYGTWQELVSYYGILYTVGGLFILGGILGFLSGGMLGMFGRPIGMKVREAFGDQLEAMMWLIPIAAIGFVVAGWIAFTVWAISTFNWIAVTLVAGAWFLSIGVVSAAINRGWLGMQNVAKRVRKLGGIRVRVEFDNSEKNHETGTRSPSLP
jgi:hypothetical protein